MMGGWKRASDPIEEKITTNNIERTSGGRPMMYLSYANEDIEEGADELLLAVVLDDKTIGNVKRIKEICSELQFPYPPLYRFTFPKDKVRLLEKDFLDDYLKDCKEYASWEIGGDDPLDYYHFQLHPYEPKKDFWHCIQPIAVVLDYSGGNTFGFEASHGGKGYVGYRFDWCKLLD
jgi:hypothetical protein